MSNKGIAKFEIHHHVLYNNTIVDIRYMGKENGYLHSIMKKFESNAQVCIFVERRSTGKTDPHSRQMV